MTWGQFECISGCIYIYLKSWYHHFNGGQFDVIGIVGYWYIYRGTKILQRTGDDISPIWGGTCVYIASKSKITAKQQNHNIFFFTNRKVEY